VCLVRIAVCLGVVSWFVGTQQTVRTATVLVSQWRLDEGTGRTTSDSVASGSGRLRNGATWTTGRNSAAVSMDGVNDYISLPSLEVTGSALTVSAWVKNSSFPSGVAQRFISKAVDGTESQTYWMLGQINNGQNRLHFRLRAGGATTTLIASTGNLPLNTWYHAAATYDGSNMRLFLNGVQVGSVAKSGPLSSGPNVAVNIGRSPEGSNYLSGAIDDVRIYSSALTSAEVAALAGTSTNQPPTVSLSGPANGASFAAGTTITVSATAADANGTVSSVQFFDGSASIGTDTSSPYSVSWSGAAVGSHTLKAVATDNGGATTESATRTVTVTSSTPPPTNQPPSVSLTAPSSGATFNAPASITLNATASDADGSIARVEFYNGTTRLGTDTSSPYSFSWTSVAAGSYSLKAVAYDNAGGMTSSSTLDVTVKPPNLPSTAAFTPSSNHATAVDRYVVEIFPAGADTTVANPVATRDIGKPAITNGEIRADISSTILALNPGNYVATVTAFGAGGSSQSPASPQFTR